MHEFGLLDSLLETLSTRADGHLSGPVESIRLRRGWGVSEAALRQAFAMQAPGTLFEGARLEVMDPVIAFRCRCGETPTEQALEDDHHVWSCPACGQAQPVPAGHELEVLSVSLR